MGTRCDNTERRCFRTTRVIRVGWFRGRETYRHWGSASCPCANRPAGVLHRPHVAVVGAQALPAGTAGASGCITGLQTSSQGGQVPAMVALALVDPSAGPLPCPGDSLLHSPVCSVKQRTKASLNRGAGCSSSQRRRRRWPGRSCSSGRRRIPLVRPPSDEPRWRHKQVSILGL